jgi:transcriptional regulator with XRE-family HTH domain
MTSVVEKLFAEFVSAHEAGSSPDPVIYIEQAGEESEVLAAMVSAFLAGRRDLDVREEDVLLLAAQPELDVPVGWDQLLPELRARRGLTRKALVSRLAGLLGVKGSEPQVAGYLHELETGQLSGARVRPSVVTAIAEALQAPVSVVASSRFIPPAIASQELSVFAREAHVPPADALSMLADEPPPDPRVDDLFTGGPDG